MHVSTCTPGRPSTQPPGPYDARSPGHPQLYRSRGLYFFWVGFRWQKLVGSATHLNWWEIWRICVCFVYCFSRKWTFFFGLSVRKKLRIDATSELWPRREPTHGDYAPILSRSCVSAVNPEDITEVKTKESGRGRDQKLFNLFGSGRGTLKQFIFCWSLLACRRLCLSQPRHTASGKLNMCILPAWT